MLLNAYLNVIVTLEQFLLLLTFYIVEIQYINSVDSVYSMNRIFHQDGPKCSLSPITEWKKSPGAGNWQNEVKLWTPIIFKTFFPQKWIIYILNYICQVKYDAELFVCFLPYNFFFSISKCEKEQYIAVSLKCRNCSCST